VVELVALRRVARRTAAQWVIESAAASPFVPPAGRRAELSQRDNCHQPLSDGHMIQRFTRLQ
jgi:hypothetical protein